MKIDNYEIPSATDMRMSNPNIDIAFTNAINKQIKMIKAATAEGRNECLWIFYGNTTYECFQEKARNMFEKQGYGILWYGVSGGVWQDEKKICW